MTRKILSVILILIIIAGCSSEVVTMNLDSETIPLNHYDSTNDTITIETPPAEIDDSEEKVDAEVNHVSLLSFNGIYRIETFGVNKSITAAGLYPVEGIRLMDTASEQVQWSTTPGYYNNSFLWSPDDRFVGVNFESRISGGTYVVDTQNMSEIVLPYLQEVQQNWDVETTVHENRPDPYFNIVEWLNSSQVSVAFQWTGLEAKEYSGSYTYDVLEGKLLNLIINELDYSN